MQNHTLSSPRSLLWVAACALALSALAYADYRFPNMGWWLFVGLALSVGMFHGALDALLLLREFGTQHKNALLLKMMFLYMLATIVAGVVLAQSLPVALIALLGLSVWHFGEPYGRWPSHTWEVRLMVGGASVMLPVLVSPVAMRVLLGQIFGVDEPSVWQLWQGMAWAWLFFSAVQLLRMWRCKSIGTAMAVLEVAVLVVLNALLSPLTAFALYFGVYHSVSHIMRVLRTQAVAGKHVFAQSLVWLTVAVTAMLILLLWQFLVPAAQTSGIPQINILHLLIVSLAAVTLPHLLLVSRCANWLQPKD